VAKVPQHLGAHGGYFGKGHKGFDRFTFRGADARDHGEGNWLYTVRTEIFSEKAWQTLYQVYVRERLPMLDYRLRGALSVTILGCLGFPGNVARVSGELSDRARLKKPKLTSNALFCWRYRTSSRSRGLECSKCINIPEAKQERVDKPLRILYSGYTIVRVILPNKGF